MTTLVLGAHGPLGLACTRLLLQRGTSVIAAVQEPRRVPPALHDIATEHADLLRIVEWSKSRRPVLPSVDDAIVVELPIPPHQTEESIDPTADLRALDSEAMLTETRALLTPSIAALQVVAAARPARVLLQASWLGSVEDKIRGGGYVGSAAYAAHLMLVRSAALDLRRAGIATVVANAGRYRLDMAGPEFHADVDTVASGLLQLLTACRLDDEPAFLDWRGTLRHW
jgi:NAD(P)-dependent dehydrogenase (short-subunit alcohol dehydrogenase family)